MEMEDLTGISAAVGKIAELGRDATTIEIVDVSPPAEAAGLTPFQVGFNHNTGEIEDLRDHAEKWRIHPERRKGTATVLTLRSFIELANRHKSAHSVIFASSNWPNPSMTAIIDYHEAGAGKPQFGEHRVHYPFPVTDEFKAWSAQDGKVMNQTEFAAFIEERVAELSQATRDEELALTELFGSARIATPADMLALSRGLEVNVAGKVKQNTRLSSGEGEIVFTEDHLDGSGAKIVVPNLFMICLPVFLDGQPVRLPARLRYRVANGSVAWFYQLYRWKEIVRERVVEDLATAATDTELPSFEGSAEMSGAR